MATKSQPRGIRNNNPGNIEWGSPWQGLVSADAKTDPRFAQFVEPAYGIRALAVVLLTYYDKRKARDGSKIDSIREIIERWAPPHENNVTAYAESVAKVLEVSPDSETLNLHDYTTLRGIVEGIIRHENGPGPLNNTNTWYSDGTIDEGLRRAGVVKEVQTTAAVPVTKTTSAAAGVAVVGVAQVADMITPIKQAMDSAHDDISSGMWVRIAFGVVTIALGFYVGYVQYRKHKAGASA